MNKVVGKRIKRLIREQGITQKELAEQTGIADSIISRYISGKQFPATHLSDIAEALSITRG